MDREMLVVLAKIVPFLVLFAIAAMIGIRGFRGFQAASAKRIDDLCARYHVEVLVEGVRYATINYHVYWGFLNTLTTLRVVWQVREDDALECLSALLRFNLSRGIWGAGAAFVPPAALFRYWQQRRVVVDARDEELPLEFP